MNKFDISTARRSARTLVTGAALMWAFAAPAFATNLDVDGNLTVGGNAVINGQVLNPGLAGAFSWPRNLVDNGSMLVQQRGTGTATAAGAPTST
jgi:exopolysaccharide biosynthesis protein